MLYFETISPPPPFWSRVKWGIGGSRGLPWWNLYTSLPPPRPRLPPSWTDMKMKLKVRSFFAKFHFLCDFLISPFHFFYKLDTKYLEWNSHYHGVNLHYHTLETLNQGVICFIGNFLNHWEIWHVVCWKIWSDLHWLKNLTCNVKDLKRFLGLLLISYIWLLCFLCNFN